MALISGWIRYAATSTSLSPQSAYALLMFGQVISHPLISPHFASSSSYQRYSLHLDNPSFRSSVPCILKNGSISRAALPQPWLSQLVRPFLLPPPQPSHSLVYTANPIGSAIGQLLSPIVGTARYSVSRPYYIILSFLLPAIDTYHPTIPIDFGFSNHLHSYYTRRALYHQCPPYSPQ